ncbi:MAG: 50S ribosomal protein L29 [Candidatus Dormibacteria bacterium]
MTQRVAAVDNLRQMTADELSDHLREQRGQLFQVRLQQTIGQVENHRQIRAIRKEIARTMTIQVQARLASQGAGVGSTSGAATSAAASEPVAGEPAPRKRRLGRRAATLPAESAPVAAAGDRTDEPASAAAVADEPAAAAEAESSDAHLDTSPPDGAADEAPAPPKDAP